MIKYTSNLLELRGSKVVTSEKGNTYGLIFAEDEKGEAFKFFCRDLDLMDKLQNFDKGSKIKLVVSYNRFKDLVVEDILFDNKDDIELGSKYLDMEL